MTISPTLVSYVGTETITVTLSDGALLSSYTFKITVTNSAPKFIAGQPRDQTVSQGRSVLYTLPAVVDDEKQEVSVSHSQLPSFVSFASVDKTYTIQPSLSTATGIYLVSGDLSDGTLSNPFNFKIKITLAP